MSVVVDDAVGASSRPRDDSDFLVLAVPKGQIEQAKRNVRRVFDNMSEEPS